MTRFPDQRKAQWDAALDILAEKESKNCSRDMMAKAEALVEGKIIEDSDRHRAIAQLFARDFVRLLGPQQA